MRRCGRELFLSREKTIRKMVHQLSELKQLELK